MAITPVRFDGFGSGRMAAPHPYIAVTGTPTVVSTPIRGNSSYSMRINTVNTFVQYLNTSAANRIRSISFYVRFASFNASNRTLVSMTTGGSSGKLYYDAASGQLMVSANNGGGTQTGGPVLSLDTWYRVTLEMDSSANPWVLRCQVDDTTEFQHTNAVTANDIVDLNVGHLAGTNAYDAYFNSVVMSDTDGDYETMRDLASHDIETLRPTSDGTHNAVSSTTFKYGSGAGVIDDTTTVVWQALDEHPFETVASTTTLQQEADGTDGKYLEVLYGDLVGSGSIEGVWTLGMHTDEASAGSSLCETKLLLSDNTEILTAGGLSMIDSTEDPGTSATLRSRIVAAPSGGWDITKVNGLKSRFGYGDANPDGHLFDIAVEVLLSTEAGGGSQFFPVIVGV